MKTVLSPDAPWYPKKQTSKHRYKTKPGYTQPKQTNKNFDKWLKKEQNMWKKRKIADMTDKITARQAFEALYSEYGLNESDAAWLVFKNGWDAALDEASRRFEQMPFGDTSASFSAYAQGLKHD